MNKSKLEVGQTVWIESRHYNFLGGSFSRKLYQAEIVASNKYSAYAVLVENLKDEKPLEYRIEQRTGKIKDSFTMFGHSYHLWRTKEDYERDVQYKADLEAYSLRIVQSVKDCKDLSKLKEAIKILER